MNHQTLRAALQANSQLSEASEASLAGFLDEYFGVSHDTPFGGRERELQALDDWLIHPTHQFALVVSEAGRGKSALLTRWAARIAARSIRVAFAPISIRFGTSLRGAAMRLLSQQLSSLTKHKLSEARHVEALRAECEAMLSAAHDTPLLIVLDGVDEATGWQLGEDLTLSTAGANCKILLSARSTPSLNAQEWRHKLGLESNRTSLFSVEGLSPKSVSELIAESTSVPLDERAALSNGVYRLSQGDPLLVRLYLESLRAAPQTQRSLPQTPPGLEGWFSLWWSQLRARWIGTPEMEPLTEDIFDLLAASLGPLPQQTLLSLLGSHHGHEDLEKRVSILLQDIRPLLVGDGGRVPFVLSHPRLRYFRLEQMPQDRRDALNQRFISVGEAELTALREGRMLPREASPYLIRYLGAHMKSSLPKAGALDTLVCPAWQAAWEALEGTYDGFLDDVDRAWKQAEEIVRASFVSKSSVIPGMPDHAEAGIQNSLAIERNLWAPVSTGAT